MRGWTKLFFSALIAGAAVNARAQVPYTLPNSAGWEASGPTAWSAGPIAGQNGWEADATPTDGEVVTGTTLLGGQTIMPKTGTQMVMSRSSYAGNDFRFATPDSASLAATCLAALSQTSVLVVESDFYLPSSEAGKDGWHGLYVFDNEDAMNGGGGNYAIAGILLRNSARTLELDGDGMTLTPNAFPRDQWFHVRLLVDFQRHVTFAYVNGVLAAQETASNTATSQTIDGTGNVGYVSLCSLSPAMDASGKLYTVNPSGPPPADPNAYYAPQTVTFSDNFAASTLSVAQAPAVGAALAVPLTFDGVSDLSASPSVIPTGYPATTTVADLIGPLTFNIRPAGGTTTLFQKIETFTQVNGPTGSCSLFGLTPGAYDIAIKSFNGLQSIASGVIVTSSNQTLPVINIAGGDANNDNAVDVLDFGLLVNAYSSNSSNPTTGYDKSADFNYDGLVDVLDFGILVNHYGEYGVP